MSSRRALRRPALALVALAIVALGATACLPPSTATAPAPTTTTTAPAGTGTANATIVHCPVVGFTYSTGSTSVSSGGPGSCGTGRLTCS